MTKEEAIQNFCSYNGIDMALLNNDVYDDPLIRGLSDKVDLWLKSIEDNDHELFLRMLSRYTYITNTVSVRRYEEAVRLLETHLAQVGIDICDTLFITVESSSAMKCGSDNVRTDLHRRCIDRIDAAQIVASATRLADDDVDNKAAFVFTDDIVSTGFTLWSTIDGFLSRFPQVKDKPLFYICMVPTQSGTRYITKKSKSNGMCITPIYKKEWNSTSAFRNREIFSDEEKAQSQSKILLYEEMVDSYMKKEEITYIFGFRESKQLVSFYYNTPNNTLCTFWRETDQHTPLVLVKHFCNTTV